MCFFRVFFSLSAPIHAVAPVSTPVQMYAGPGKMQLARPLLAHLNAFSSDKRGRVFALDQREELYAALRTLDRQTEYEPSSHTFRAFL